MGGEHAHQLFPLGQETQQRPGPLQLVIGMLQEVELPGEQHLRLGRFLHQLVKRGQRRRAGQPVISQGDQQILHLRHSDVGQLRTQEVFRQHVAQHLQRVGFHVAVEPAHPAAQDAGAGHQQQCRRTGGHPHDFNPADNRPLLGRGGGHRRAAGALGQRLGRLADQPLGIAGRTGQHVVNILLILIAEGLPAHQMVDIQPERLSGGNPPRRCVRLLQVSPGGQLGHLVADGGGGHRVAQHLHQCLGADRLAGLDVRVNNRGQYLLFAFAQFHVPSPPYPALPMEPIWSLDSANG